MSPGGSGITHGQRKSRSVRAVMTGQVGVEKKPFCEAVAEMARSHGKEVVVCHVGDRMYAEAPDVVPGRILDLPRSRLDAMRRSVFKDILRIAERADNVLVNTHATFRWKHGLFPAFDHDQMEELDAGLYFTLVDNVEAVHERLTREHDLEHTLKDILVWREEEIMATDIMSGTIRGHGCSYVIARGCERDTARSVYQLMFEPARRKVYPSFPMTHVADMPEVLSEIDSFREVLSEQFVTFDPGDLDERRLLIEAGAAIQRGERSFLLEVHGRAIEFAVEEVTSVTRDIDGQIYARDFKLIDQADMIVSFVPELPDGKPGLSSGVERELQHAYETTKEVYIVWKPRADPSPFVTKTASRVFRSMDETLAFFQKKGYVKDYQLRFDPTRTPRDRE